MFLWRINKNIPNYQQILPLIFNSGETSLPRYLELIQYMYHFLSGCLSVDEVTNQLEMLKAVSSNKFIVVGTSIHNWDSVQNALKTVCDLILRK